MKIVCRQVSAPRLTIGIALSIVAGIIGLGLSAGPVAAATGDPSPVANVTATPGPGTLTVSWTPANPGGSSYGTTYSIVGYTVKATAAGVSGTVTCMTQAPTCTLTGLSNGRDYFLQITARNSMYGESNVWGVGPFKPCCSTPSSPVSVTATASPGAAAIAWGAPSNALETGGAVITYSAMSEPAGAQCTTTGLSCAFQGLVNGTSYTFLVTASTSFGASAPARSAAVTPVGLPGAPSGVVGYIGDRGSVNVNWVGPASTGGAVITEYVATAAPGGANCVSPGTQSCTIAGLSNGTGYTFTVTARNVVGVGPASLPSSVARVLAGPGKPKSVVARVAGRGAATVTWKPPASTGGLKVTKYVVKASPSGKGCTTTKLVCAIGGLTDSTDYVFSVQAFNSKGAGLPGQTTPIRTPPTPPKPELTLG